jgi:hypothetical protein
MTINSSLFRFVSGPNVFRTSNDDVSLEFKWVSGLIALLNGFSVLFNNTFESDLSGGLFVDGGKVNLDIDNNFSCVQSVFMEKFPSAKRNIHCEGNGEIYFGPIQQNIQKELFNELLTLNESLWIDNKNCVFSGFGDDIRSLLFLPILEKVVVKEYSSSTPGTLEITYYGQQFYPYNELLFQYSKEINESSVFNLSSFIFFNETMVTGVITSDVNGANNEMVWLGRVLFVNESIPIDFMEAIIEKEIPKKNQSLPVNVLIAIIVGSIVTSLLIIGFLIILIIYIIHRNKKGNSKKSKKEKMKEKGNSINSRALLIGGRMLSGNGEACSSGIGFNPEKDSLSESSSYSSDEGSLEKNNKNISSILDKVFVADKKDIYTSQEPPEKSDNQNGIVISEVDI